ncbi:MAG: Cna B-type domain-containing protein, partial [Firmicutes bacterium]|nr:Cna B-type domain-containing protein [Bacillota bacterium]
PPQQGEQPHTGTSSIQGAKTWRHGSLPVNRRPGSLEIIIKADGKTILTDTVTAADHWKWSYELPKCDAAGREIAYTVEEAPLPGYTTAVDGHNVTNTHESYGEVTFAGVKSWDHGGNTGQKPQSVVVHVMDGGKVVATKRVTAEDKWAYSFTLPKYREDGSEAVYTVGEDPVPGYGMTKTDGRNMLNVYQGENARGSFATPKTDDDSNLPLWTGMTAASFALLVIVLARGRRVRKT